MPTPHDAPSTTEDVDALIVGAGPAGLAVGATLRRTGVPFVIVEAGEHVGGGWRDRYDRLHLHTVKRYSALPFAPFPGGVPRYPSRQQVVAYLDAYARRFGLRPRFREAVIAARFEDGAWRTRTSAGIYRSRSLIVCTGVNRVPVVPTWGGEEGYGGDILHSGAYRDGEPYRGQRVLVIGMGNSGAEIALDLCEHGAEVGIAVRGGVNIVPRDPLGIPVQVLSIVAPSIRPQLTDALMRPLWRRLIGDLRPFGIAAPPYGPTTGVATRGRIPVIDVGTVRLIREGRIAVRGAVARFMPHGVAFADGSEGQFDAVVLATGFRPALDAFLPQAAAVTDPHGYPTAHGRPTALPGLYFCGFHNVSTGLLREIGREARRIGREIAARAASPA